METIDYTILRHEPNEDCDGTTANPAPNGHQRFECLECEEIYCDCEMVAGHRCWNK